jgi:hypothetical protein
VLCWSRNSGSWWEAADIITIALQTPGSDFAALRRNPEQVFQIFLGRGWRGGGWCGVSVVSLQPNDACSNPSLVPSLSSSSHATTDQGDLSRSPTQAGLARESLASTLQMLSEAKFASGRCSQKPLRSAAGSGFGFVSFEWPLCFSAQRRLSVRGLSHRTTPGYIARTDSDWLACARTTLLGSVRSSSKNRAYVATERLAPISALYG